MDDAAIAIARNPSELEQSLTDCGADGSRKVISPFSPIETTACEAALLRSQLIYIDAPLPKKLLASRCHIKFTVAIDTSDQVSALLERFSQADRHSPGQVVVT